MNHTILPHAALALTALLAVPVLAQPSVDIDLHGNSSGGIEVQLTPETDFYGVPSSLVFTITWDGAAASTVPELQQSAEQRALLPLAPSGPVHEVGDKRYRIYSGIGLTPLQDAGQLWRGGMSAAIGTFEQGMPNDITIADDAWVKERRHNGAFYISLNGFDRTGAVRGASSTREDTGAFSLSVAPNPWNAGPLAVELRGVPEGELRLELTDASGKSIWSHTYDNADVLFRTDIRTDTQLSAGTYTLTVRMADAQKSRSITVISGVN